MINAITYMDELEKNGFTQPQAKTSVNLWLELMNENLATKNEMRELNLVIRSDMKEMYLSLKNETNELRNDIRVLQTNMYHFNEKLDKLYDLFKWSFGLMIGLFAGLYLKIFFG